MTYDEIFKLCNMVSLITWVVLAIIPYYKWTQRIATGVIVTAFAALYTWLVVSGFTADGGDFSSFATLDGVHQLFTSKKAVLTGWIHYLAFDLMTGIFILNSAQKHGINRLLILPCLFFTFMLGPIGLLLFFMLRAVKTRQYFHQYI